MFLVRYPKKFFLQNLHFGPIRWVPRRFLSHFRKLWHAHAEHMRKRFYRMLSIQGTNFRACSASGKMWTVFTCTIYAEHTRNEFYRTLSIRGTTFIACWAYAEPISSHAEHAGKCLKVEYLGRIEYDFQKSRVTGPWNHKVSVSAKKVKTKFNACVPLNCPPFRLLCQ